MADGMDRAERLLRVKELFEGNPGGFTTAELAELTGVDQRTSQRDIAAIQRRYMLALVKDGDRYRIYKAQRLGSLNLTLQQARALIIATRLFLRYSEEGDLDAAGALQQVAQIMPERIRGIVTAAAQQLADRPVNQTFARNIVCVTDAWAKRRVLEMTYKSAGSTRPKEVILHPYILEPSAAGYATYVIGYSESHDQIRTFKVERVVSCKMLPRGFDLPEDFDADELLSSAWGIIFGEGQQVRLRFKQDVAWRVRESKWHPSQEIEELEGGGVLLTLSVASMMELGRWVRSWGDRVEVLEPPELRKELQEEAWHLARLYSKPSKQPRKAKVQRKPKPKRARASAPLEEARPVA